MISGELFQSLCSFGVTSSVTDVISAQKIKGKIISVKDCEKIQLTSRKIFVYGDSLIPFLEATHHRLDDTTLVVHNSDKRIDDSIVPYLNGVSRLFGQNLDLIHPKCYGIPIGISNSQWKELGDISLLNKVRALSVLGTKHRLILKNFARETNPGVRNLCDEQTSWIKMDKKRSQENYWYEVAGSNYVLAPEGNGLDCHRIWEALFLRTVPVVKRCKGLSHFEGLPILFVDSWEEVTVEFLHSRWPEFSTRLNYIPELSLDYWRLII